MGLTMKKILKKFDDCNKFCLTGRVSKYNFTITEEEYNDITKNMNFIEREKFTNQFLEKYTITEDEFNNALNKIKNKDKEDLKYIYEINKDKLKNYPNFETLYNEIEKECYEFGNEKNIEYYFNESYGAKKLIKLKDEGLLTLEEFNNRKKDRFKYRFIADNLGKTTKYGKDYCNLFYQFYSKIASNIDREQLKTCYCVDNGKNPILQIPIELKKYFLYYEVSFYNEVTISGGLMINYYFELNDVSKEYLLKFRNDFELRGLEDLTLYKDNEVKFYSCTHEGFNSIKFDYKDMTKEEIIEFINDEYFDNDNTKIIDGVFKVIDLIDSNESIVFTFKEIGIEEQQLMNEICDICSEIGLKLTSKKVTKDELIAMKENGNYNAVSELPAVFCNVEDIIGKEIII